MNKCTCGKREQNKCCVESDTKTGKMCLKEDMTLPDHEKRLLSDPDYRSLWFEQCQEQASDYFQRKIRDE